MVFNMVVYSPRQRKEATMNWHLFLDAMAVIWGIILALYSIVAIIDCNVNWKVWASAIFASLCWAWIIAG